MHKTPLLQLVGLIVRRKLRKVGHTTDVAEPDHECFEPKHTDAGKVSLCMSLMIQMGTTTHTA